VQLHTKYLDEYNKRELARKIALVPQFYNINFPYTAKEIVLMGRYPHLPRFAAIGEEEERLIQETMVATNTLELADRPITELSGGERQRVVFARALAQQTPLLFLDEATANLDINHTLNLLSLVRQKTRSEKFTVIAVFQDMNLAATFCDRLILLQQGQLQYCGEIEQVLAPGPLQEVFGVETSTYRDPCFGRHRVICRIPEIAQIDRQ
jgi:iron complex transport system ATP-binding protein